MNLPFQLLGPFNCSAHRYLDLQHPYIGLAALPTCGQQLEELDWLSPRPGEAGLGLYWDFADDMTGWNGFLTIARPDGTQTHLHGCLKDGQRMVAVTQEGTFPISGMYRVQWIMWRGSQKWPQACVNLYVTC